MSMLKQQNKLDSVITKNEFKILTFLNSKVVPTQDIKSSEIIEIAQDTGIRDTDEVLRALYTLEGKNFVEPSPKGDLTSKLWHITNFGIKAIGVFKAQQ